MYSITPWLKRIREDKKLRLQLACSHLVCKSSWIPLTSLDLNVNECKKDNLESINLEKHLNCTVKFMKGLESKIPIKKTESVWNKGGGVDMKIHMAFKGGLVKYPRSSTQGGGGVENTQKSIHMVYGCSLREITKDKLGKFGQAGPSWVNWSHSKIKMKLKKLLSKCKWQRKGNKNWVVRRRRN